MPVNKIINKTSDYYIAMYSAHASIIENLIGKYGVIKKLLIDAGGLKAPKDSYTDKAIFNNYSPVTNKTLHAKIIYLDKLKTLSLWTGNLRKQTLNEQENIVITKKISDKNCSQVKKWFTASEQKEHLIIDVTNSSISQVICTKNNIWSSFKNSLENKQFKDNDELSLYAFSPWGSGEFVKKTVKQLRKNLHKISLHTRPASKKAPLWIDAEIEKRNDNLRIERYVKQDDTPFPHYKCVFITRKDGKEEKLIWAYVGSANLTKAAFFKKSNIEFAVFFDKIRSGSEIDKIFNSIKKKTNWEERIPLKSKKKTLDESELEYGEDDDSQNNFEIRRLSKDLCNKFKTKTWQAKLEDGYRKEDQIRLNKCTIKVVAVLDGIFDLHVSHKEKKLNFPLSIRRDNANDIYSSKDTKELVDKLLEKSYSFTHANKGNSRKIDTKKRTAIKPFRNMRFPIANCILYKEFITDKKKIMGKLSDAYEQLTNEDKKIVAMWSQILEELR